MSVLVGLVQLYFIFLLIKYDLMNGMDGGRIRTALWTCLPSWRVSAHTALMREDETGVRRGNLQRSCHVITLKGNVSVE
jgi:hypothetical protein